MWGSYVAGAGQVRRAYARLRRAFRSRPSEPTAPADGRNRFSGDEPRGRIPSQVLLTVPFGVMQVDSVSWWEPHYAMRRRALAEMRVMGLFRPSLWAKVIGIPALFLAASSAYILWTFPAMFLPWPQLLLITVYPLLFAAVVAVHFLMPRRIEVQRRRVDFSYGPVNVVKAERIRRIELVGSPPDEQRLIVECLAARDQPVTIECVVRPSVNQEALVDIVKSLAEASAQAVAKARPERVEEGPSG